MKAKVSLGLILMVLISTASCKKYPEGPGLTIRSKKGRVANKWKIDKYLIGGVDSTVYHAAEGTWLEMTKDGKVTATQVQSNGVQSFTTNYTGDWEFSEDKEEIGVVLTDDLTSTADTTVYDIIKLKEKEMWLKDENTANSNKTVELQFIPY